MLLILSTEYDTSTNKVIDWLIHSKIPFLRLNDTSAIELHKFELYRDKAFWCLEITESFKKKSFYLSSDQIKNFWYRRGLFNFSNKIISTNSINNNIPFVISKLYNYTKEDKTSIVDFLYLYLNRLKHLGYFHENKTIKIHNLLMANKSGLNIPATIVATRKEDILEFQDRFGKCITKGINENGFFVSNMAELSTLTQIVEKSIIEKLPENFAPSIIQEYIEKLFELRIFYINKKCYAAAIFSQSDEKTKIDFRNYNEEHPNRLVPYDLPDMIQQQLITFMETVGMKTGSVDMIVSTKMEYIFLEVNPIGQFDWISKKCNYQLEKVIASYFIN
jgi:ATP-GRASP peptide maturase of grasp-with-spasm system